MQQAMLKWCETVWSTTQAQSRSWNALAAAEQRGPSLLTPGSSKSHLCLTNRHWWDPSSTQPQTMSFSFSTVLVWNTKLEKKNRKSSFGQVRCSFPLQVIFFTIEFLLHAHHFSYQSSCALTLFKILR